MLLLLPKAAVLWLPQGLETSSVVEKAASQPFANFPIHIIDILQNVVDRHDSACAHQLTVFYSPSGLCAGRE